ncbi:envelope stress response membrane protein PspC [Salidesulfovibrio onnuriiensis]|uniref:envelope stress response membrane protein PspC n=1 Tax=Salidesulfovibrio onnuriiensis TaxID=2583823 RepID=UPI0011C873BD|nr:envelope stress response membrane protein PspC [Salidesulfovibrio onnuriiensis]
MRSSRRNNGRGGWRGYRRDCGGSFQHGADGASRGRGLYRSRDGRVLGVCKGLAEYFDVRVSVVRAAVIVAFIFTGFWPVVGLYLLAAFFMKPEPVMPFAREEDREFYDSYTDSRAGALTRIKRKFESLDRRIRRMEDVVTSKDFEWEQRMNGSR